MRRTLLALACLGAPLLAQEYGEDHRLKVDISGGETRKVGFFVPKGLKKNQAVPLVVAVPGDEGKAVLELGQWQQMGFEHGFAVVSVDIQTASRGWLPSEQIEMQRDAEAVTKAVEAAREKAKETGVALDDTAFVITGYSGGTSTLHRSLAKAQRGWKEHPGGGLTSAGGRPLITVSSWPFWSTRGIDSSSAFVYG